MILTSLSVLWDFRVFTQIYVLQKAGGITRDTNLLGVYAYRISIGAEPVRQRRRGRDRDGADHAAADALLPALDDAAGGAVSGGRAHASVAQSAAQPCASNLLGLAVFVVAIVPRVLDGADVVPARRRHPEHRPRRSCRSPARCSNYRKVFERDFFWTAVRNSLTVTLLVVVARAVRSPSSPRSPCRASGSAAAGRSSSRCCSCRWCPAEALIISLFRMLDGWQLINTIIGLTLTYLVVRPAVHDLDAARLRRQRARSSSRRRRWSTGRAGCGRS